MVSSARRLPAATVALFAAIWCVAPRSVESATMLSSMDALATRAAAIVCVAACSLPWVDAGWEAGGSKQSCDDKCSSLTPAGNFSCDVGRLKAVNTGAEIKVVSTALGWWGCTSFSASTTHESSSAPHKRYSDCSAGTSSSKSCTAKPCCNLDVR